MLVRSDAAPATGAVLRIPAALAHGVLPSGLTAPALRAFIVLLGHAADDGAIDILKPVLVEESGTRIDAMHRFLEPLRSTAIDVAEGHGADGEAWFSELSYIPGERTKYAGIVKGTASVAARAVLAETGRHGTISIAIDELRRLRTVPGILLYLRLREEMARSPKAMTITMRAVVEDLHGLFGCYCAAAVSRKTTAAGEIETTLGLSRVTSTLLRPAIDDVALAIDEWDLGLQEGRTAGAGKGVRWKHVDILAGRLAPKKTLKDVMAAQRDRRKYEARIGKANR